MTIDYGTLVRMRRVDLHMTQKELADRACVHPQTVWGFEHNRKSVTMDTFLSILNALDLKIDIVEVQPDE